MVPADVYIHCTIYAIIDTRPRATAIVAPRWSLSKSVVDPSHAARLLFNSSASLSNNEDKQWLNGIVSWTLSWLRWLVPSLFSTQCASAALLEESTSMTLHLCPRSLDQSFLFGVLQSLPGYHSSSCYHQPFSSNDSFLLGCAVTPGRLLIGCNRFSRRVVHSGFCGVSRADPDGWAISACFSFETASLPACWSNLPITPPGAGPWKKKETRSSADREEPRKCKTSEKEDHPSQ
ncbi:hypothetical protein BD289DRAFT_125558 [Coniella lustricola]|uniref:Uncharacterized protein n=1 Tax=Coniella lustricola TaxID=2025994 RepID=A0A2T3AFV8_9PEZI|nr:hypothetical protein BD289DRAFT_125558 [Coniella lustricola]